MNKTRINDKVILRLPRFSYQAQLKDCWDDLKKMIRDGSPDFYNIIKNLSHDELARADKKVRQTVQKYFNRSRFRATPYGQFATVGLGILGHFKEPVIVDPRPTVHRFTDWPEHTPAAPNIEQIRNTNVLLFTNTTFYQLQNEIRFIQKAGTEYQLAAIDHDPIISDLLEKCMAPVKYNDLKAATGSNLLQEDFDAYVNYLLGVQLLITSLHPNIIGKDYFARVPPPKIPYQNYIISERTAIKGSFDAQLFRHLPDLVQTLQQVLPFKETETLEDFKSRFIKRFEDAEIPLMLALDAEAGIGYGHLEQYGESQWLEPFFRPIAKPVLTEEMVELRNRLYKEIIGCSLSREPVALEKLVQDNMVASTLPNSISIGVTPIDDLLFVDYLGGATANAIAGRFALAVPQLKEFCQSVAKQEQTDNPDVLFFDIGYIKEIRVDNINRRPSIYDLQLNILAYDTSESPLCANDLLISVRNNEVILRSQRLRKRVMPRMTTAYNYRRSDLPLFRLLMDLQNQGLRTELLFRHSALIPGLDYYPRLQFRNIIVTPASWLLTTGIIENRNTIEEKTAALSTFLKDRAVCRYIKTGIADQTLLLDTSQTADTELLLNLLEKKGSIYIEESLLPRRSTVTGTDGQPFLPQLVLTLQRSTPISKPATLVPSLRTTRQKQWIAPGADWLYFEIYCTPYRMDSILDEKIHHYLNENRETISKWFFIRYNEGGDHIRLRLQLKDSSKGYELIAWLSAALQPELESGVVHDIKLCTYKKELARYTADMMDAIETHFYTDSEFILSMLQAMLSVNARYRLCTDLFNSILESGIFDSHQAGDFLNTLTAAHNKEHHITVTQFKEINKRYKEFCKQPLPSLSAKSAALHGWLKKSFVEVLGSCPESFRTKLLGDLMHMHINRLFAKDQRMHEMIIYNFLQLEYKSRAHRQSISAFTKWG